ncbi:SWIM zinc finger family protein [Streptomyces sp. NPDC046860]|uniref:SWIM zinc finger family protein n=1 Tax=Streptomyces sp. NPDC046860 TaxID=3154495 RepID=UPI0033D7EB81
MSSGGSGPAEAAREALRAARGRAEGEPGAAERGVSPASASASASASAEGARAALRGASDASGAPGAADVSGADSAASQEPEGEAASGTGGARPGEVARAALRAAVAARREGADADSTDADADADADASSGSGSGGDADADDAGSGTPPAPADPSPTPGTPAPGTARPGDVAREALRAARREAELRPRRPAPRVVPAPAPAEGTPRSARAQAARDMRDFLSNAFRMPDWADDPEAPEAPEATEARPSDGTREPLGMAALLKAAPAVPRDRDRTPPHSVPAPSDPSAPAPDPGADHRAPESGHEPSAPAVTSAHPHPAHPAPAQIPPSMATPHRDGEHRRTFPPFAPRPESHHEFAGTWWGQAWVDALEHTALDVNRVLRGRGYADAGNVDAITVTPGLLLAYVRGSRPRPYRVQMRLRTLSDADWDRFLEAAADSPAHIAALLDKELPHTLADLGVPLLPGPGDLTSQCSCPDSGRPCKHAAALCYQAARLLDADPFVLLLLRGRGERELLDALSRRSAATAARAARERGPAALPGVRASEALAGRSLPPLPAPLPPPAHPEAPPAYPAAPGGPDPFALDQLATDAAARAHALLSTGRDPVGGLTLWQDAVRLAAARPGSGLTAATRSLYATLGAAVDRTSADLARAVAAWRQGGLAGLTVLEERWDPPAGRFDRARPLLLAAGLPAFRPWRNRLTHPAGHAQLRFGQDGLWYAYESEPGREDWWPRGAPDLDPVSALTTLDIPDSL